jgi:hypothetical protein
MVASRVDDKYDHHETAELMMSVAVHYGWLTDSFQFMDDCGEDGLVVCLIVRIPPKNFKTLRSFSIPPFMVAAQKKLGCVPFCVGVFHEEKLPAEISWDIPAFSQVQETFRHSRQQGMIPVCVITGAGMSIIGSPRHYPLDGGCQCETCLTDGSKTPVSMTKGAC